MKRLASVLLALFCTIAFAQDALSASVQSMMKTSVFAFGGVGFAGKTSQGELDFRVIQSQPPAIALDSFEKIFAGGDTEAKSYALLGIRRLDGKRFKELLHSSEGSQQKVLTMYGCILERQNFMDVVRAIDSGSYDGFVTLR